VLALLTSEQSPLFAAIKGFTGAPGSGVFAAAAPLVPMLLDSAAAQLAEVPGEVVDDVLLGVAQVCLTARSVDGEPRAMIVVAGADVAEASPAGPAHNED
jgi:hypothetical protein